jgi:hypothetical protein
MIAVCIDEKYNSNSDASQTFFVLPLQEKKIRKEKKNRLQYKSQPKYR